MGKKLQVQKSNATFTTMAGVIVIRIPILSRSRDNKAVYGGLYTEAGKLDQCETTGALIFN